MSVARFASISSARGFRGYVRPLPLLWDTPSDVSVADAFKATKRQTSTLRTGDDRELSSSVAPWRCHQFQTLEPSSDASQHRIGERVREHGEQGVVGSMSTLLPEAEWIVSGRSVTGVVAGGTGEEDMVRYVPASFDSSWTEMF
jgi:hypothetical protein